MLRNYFVAAVRNLLRSPLYSVIVIAGLALGIAPAILIGLYVLDEFSYDRWIPGHQDIYRTVLHLEFGNLQAPPSAGTAAPVAGWLQAEFPQIEAIARMQADNRPLRHEAIKGKERVYWADAAIFEVLRLPAAAGHLQHALASPDAVVLTRRIARQYLGSEAPLGQTLEIDGKPFQITAVLDDLPPQTHLDTQIFASGRSTLSPLPALTAPLRLSPGFEALAATYTYLRLKSGTDIHTIEMGLPKMVAAHVHIPRGPNGRPLVPAPAVEMQPLTRIHFIPAGMHAMTPSGSLTLDYAILAIGGLLLIISGCNFVNLMTARAGRRAVEAGVRKAAGATRGDLLLQFIGESVLATAISTVLALSLVELLTPYLNALLPHPLSFHWWQTPQLVAAIFALSALLGVLAGLYPALVLARFQPAAVLRGGVLPLQGRGRARMALVVVQLSVLIGLMVVTATVYRQSQYAAVESLRFDTGRIVAIRSDCRSALPQAVRALEGVQAAACTNDLFGVRGGTSVIITRPDGSLPIAATIVDVDWGLLELFGLTPLAGRFFSSQHPGDAAQAGDVAQTSSANLFGSGGTVVINETAAHRLGFPSLQAAVGHAAAVPGFDSAPMIIGVTPDIRLEGVRHIVQPVFFRLLPRYDYLMVKLKAGRVSETLAAIDALWGKLGSGQPIDRSFLRTDIQAMYLDVERQSALLALAAGVAVMIAVIGLLGLAAFMAERRTKEIGIRKALGARTTDIVTMLLWQFARPVLWANLISWPIAAFFMNRWLHSFVYHLDLEPAIFLGAAAAALTIAWATVLGHALRLAHLEPVFSLRYE